MQYLNARLRPIYTVCAVVFCLFVVIAMNGCIKTETVNTHGQIISEDQLALIQQGEHTRNDVAYILGTPSTLATFDDNRWYYMTSTVIDKPLNPNQLQERTVYTIVFSQNGTVEKIETVTQDDGRIVHPNTRTTPTQGQSLGVVEQMLDNVGRGGL